VADRSFLTGHALVLLCIATWGVRLRDIAARTSVTERTSYGIATGLTEAGYGAGPLPHQEGVLHRAGLGAGQFQDGGDGHRPLDPPGLGAGRAGAVPAVTLIA